MSKPLLIQMKTVAKTRPALSPMQTGLLYRKCACGQHTVSGGECAECRAKREGTMQRAVVSHTPVNAVPPIVHEVLSSPGQPMDTGTRAFMEPRFGYDFSQVRVHTDARAAESAHAVNVLAYTVGRDVVFGEGQYAPETSVGRRLMAHELTHVVQQSSGALSISSGIDKGSADSFEQSADALAAQIVSGGAQWHLDSMHHAESVKDASPMKAVSGQIDQGYTLPSSNSALQTSNSIRLQRQQISPSPSSAICTPPSSSPYARLPLDLLRTLCSSFSEHNDKNKYLDNGFWFGSKPSNLWDALDHYRSADLNALVEVHKRTQAINGLWHYVHRIRESWAAGSRGFKFVPTDADALGNEFLCQSTPFCQDTWLGGAQHPNQICWREVVSGSPGLHVCLDEKADNEGKNEIHIDVHQTVTGRGKELRQDSGKKPKQDGGKESKKFSKCTKCEYNVNPFGGPLAEHFRDISGSPKSVFERFDDASQMAQELDKHMHPGSVAYSEFKLAYTQLKQLKPYLQRQAARGVQGEQEAEQGVGDAVVKIWVTLKPLYDRLQSRRLEPETGPF